MDLPAEPRVGRPATGIRSEEPEVWGSPVRRPVAVVVSRFPKITETFILREIEELERQGQPVRLVPLLRQQEPVVHPEAVPWIERALYTPFLSIPILRENLQAFRESPGHYLRVLVRVLLGSLGSPSLFRGTLGIFPKSVYVGRLLRREGAGHLHGHFATHPAMAAYIASEFSGLPWSFTAHAHDIFLPGSRPMMDEKVRRASFVRVISEYNRAFLEKRYPVGADGRILTIHMGIDPARYGPGKPEEGRILCVASLRPYKGIPTLVEACTRTPLRDRDFRLAIVGDGPQRAELEDRIRRLGLEDRVQLLGPRTQEEVGELLSNAAIFVHPSTVTRRGWMDGIPVALMEAMATHVPVVSTWVSGIPELVEDGRQGILVFPDDPGALAEALAALLDDPDRARKMGAAGRRKVEEAFHLKRCVTSLVEALDLHVGPIPWDVSEAVGSGFEAVAGGITGDLPDTMGIRRIHRRPDSIVAELMVGTPGAAQELVVKVHREREGAPRSAAERARVEFDTLRRLHEASAAPGEEGDEASDRREEGGIAGAVPCPLAVLASEGTLVMERVPGAPLDVAIRRWKRMRDGDDSSPLPALRATGRWLRWFQEETAEVVDGAASAAADALLHRVGRDLERCRGWLPSRTVSAVRDRIEEFPSGADPDAARAVGHHCDFWPGNVFVHRSRITVIDFEGFRSGLPYEDLTYFVAHLELALPWPWRERRAGARRAFLEGYGPTELDPAVLDLCSAATALRLLAGSAGGGSVSALARWRRRRILRAMVVRSMTDRTGTVRTGRPPPTSTRGRLGRESAS